MRYSKKDREDAALICAARSAGLVALLNGYWSTSTHDFAESIGASSDALALAHDARAEAFPLGDVGFAGHWAEAEAMLRTGWSP